MSAATARLSQRQPQACQECTKRKRRCDKTIPCGRCVSLNLNCTREVITLRRNDRRDVEVKFLERLHRDLLKSSSPDPVLVRRVADRIVDLTPGSNRVHHGPGSDEDAGPEVGESDGSHLLAALEGMAWGRTSRSQYAQQKRVYSSALPADSPGGVAATDLHDLKLPTEAGARVLVDFQLQSLAWHHNCLHSTLFRNQCESFWANGVCEHPQWIALYLSVLSTSAYCIKHSPAIGITFISGSGCPSPRSLFDSMVKVLYKENFLEDLTVYAVQAITISTEVAHNLGRSQLNTVLLGAAIRIAFCLGLHEIPTNERLPIANNIVSGQYLEAELSRRIWCQMLVQELFAIPFNDAHTIDPNHYSTALPMNCNDDLVPRDESILTSSTYCRILAQLALLMIDLADGLGPLHNRKPTKEQYSHVLRMDQRMRETVRKVIPPVLLSPNPPIEPGAPSWLSIAKRSLAITAADKIIMIHRPFLLKAFQSPAYAYTRRTCVAAANTILRECEIIATSGDISIWTHTAFCITATMILCFEILYCLKDRTLDVSHYREAVRAARGRLSDRQDDVLAARGVMLIDSICHEGPVLADFGHGSSSSSTTLDLRQVIDRFLDAHNKTAAQQDLLLGMDNSSASNQYSSDDVSVSDLQEWDLADVVNFDEWYEQTFQS